MKNTLIIYGLKLAIWVLEKLIVKMNAKNSNKKESSDITVEDVVINQDTAKMFSKFIKSHTKNIQSEE